MNRSPALQSGSSGPGRGGPGLDPRTKLVVLVLALAALAMTRSIVVLAIAQAALLAGTVGLGLLRPWLRVMRVVALLSAVVFVIVHLTLGTYEATAAVLRLTAMLVVTTLVFQSAAPEEMAEALVASGLPYAFAFIVTAGMQFMPVIGRKVANVIDAQRSRGIRLEPGLAALRSYPALLLPVLIQCFRLADQLAEAMAARGFGRPGRTFARDYGLALQDGVILAMAFIAWLSYIAFIR
jgi:energy-coupling factor transporter transmembrane protein EcfT